MDGKGEGGSSGKTFLLYFVPHYISEINEIVFYKKEIV
jgi:hypothetical protein